MCCGDRVSGEARSCPHCGEPYPHPNWLRNPVLEFLRNGQRIDAIELVRDRLDCDLDAALRYVDQLTHKTR